MDRILIHRDTYHDSIFLMAASARLRGRVELTEAHVVLATPANLELLPEQGFEAGALEGLRPTDLVVALRASDEATLAQAERVVDELLAGAAPRGEPDGSGAQAIGLDGGLAQLPGANLALISVPGRYAAYEAHRAIDRGLHVMIFSDNVPLADEVALKARATKAGLLCMGPDCGTALIGGRPLGFANRVRRGPIGLVGASGTGLQEVSSQIHNLGSGVSHVIGTGGRDLHAAVEGATTVAALDLLAADDDTRAIVVIAKQADDEAAVRVAHRLATLDKPTIVLGRLGVHAERAGVRQMRRAQTLSEAARQAVAIAQGASIDANVGSDSDGGDRTRATLLTSALTSEQRFVHGLFCGGTLAGEALSILRRAGLGVASNLDDDPTAGDRTHTVVDLGADEHTQGRPHPMIDPAPRTDEIVRLAALPTTAALLLDVVLGTGSHPDPAGVVAEALAGGTSTGPRPVVLASITGTDLDAQNLTRQRTTLETAGVIVSPSNAGAALLAVAVALATAPTTEAS